MAELMGRRIKRRGRCTGCNRIIETGIDVNSGPVVGYFCSALCYNKKLENKNVE